MSDQPVETQALVVHQPQPLDVAQAMRIEDILGQVRLIQDVMRRVMVEKEHYGTIPGCGDKKTLLQPGAQKLTMTFRLAPEYNIQEVNLERGHKEYRIVCTLKSIQSGSFVGQGVGCCSTMESKYRWRGGARKCPKCGKETIIKGKAEYGGGWLCFAKKGGCGEKWPDGAKEIEGQSIDKIENDNPADCYNTVLKIAKKRAFVDATITATAASDIFTQDIGDDESPVGSIGGEYIPEEGQDQPSGRAEPSRKAESHPEPVKTHPSPVSAPPKATPESKPKAEIVIKGPSGERLVIGPKYRLQILNRLQAAPGGKQRALVHQYLTYKQWIKPDQEPEEWVLDHLPKTAEEFAKLGEAIKAYERETLEGRSVEVPVP